MGAALAIAAVFMLQAGSASSAVSCDRWASPSGNDNNGGTFGSPFKTVGKLVQSLVVGQTGCLKGYPLGSPPSAAGFYEEDPITINAPGITVRSADGQVAQVKAAITVAASNVTLSHLVLDGRNENDAASPRITAGNVTLAHNNITTRNTSDCITVAGGAQQVLIRHNRIHDCENGAQIENADYLMMVDNLIYDNTGAGVYLSPDADSNSVKRNILDANKRGIVWGSGILGGGPGVSTSSGTVASGNIVSNSEQFNVTADWHDPDGEGGAGPVRGTANAYWMGCLHHGTLPNGGVDPDTTTVGWDPEKIWQLVNADGDPLYGDAAAGDYSLQPDSPCLPVTGNLSSAALDDGPASDDQRPDDAAAVNLRPNVLVIVTDDQRASGTVVDGVMSDTRDWFRDGTSSGAPGGTEFTEGFATTPMCCPSRATIFTGQYVHNHEITNNTIAPPPSMDPTNPTYMIQPHTVQRYLRDRAGYKTGLFGKFLNSWRFSTTVTAPNFDDFGYFQGQPHCPMEVMEDPGVKSDFGSPPTGDPPRCEVQDPSDYSTTWIGQEGERFIDESEQTADDQPWLLFLNPVVPHTDNLLGRPVPEEQYVNADVPPPDDLLNSAAFQEGLRAGGNQLTDKPQYVQNMRPPCPGGQSLEDCDDDWTASILNERAEQLRTLMSVDDMVESVFTKLEQTGEADDTLAFFVSDNGYEWGEHGLLSKGKPYLESIKVPFFMRWPDNPAVERGVTDASRYVANVDIAPTVLDAVDVNPDHVVDGRSLLDPAMNRTRMLTEFWQLASIPTFASLTSPTYQYTEYYDTPDAGFREFYRFPGDLPQLTNLFQDSDPSDPLPSETDPIADSLSSLRTCAGSTCP